jgi:hypothetical protein
MQKDVVGHDTDANAFVPSILTALDQVVPFQDATSPPELEASMQKVVVGHDTEPSMPMLWIESGVPHLAPFQVIVLPDQTTAMQKDIAGHDSETGVSRAICVRSVQASGASGLASSCVEPALSPTEFTAVIT